MKYSVIKDRLDSRDLKVALPCKTNIPKLVDLREWDSPIRDQGQEGSCTGFCGTGIMALLYKKYKGESLIFSPQFLYRAERICEGDVDQDGGAQSRTMQAVMNEVGVCLESSDPYTDTGWSNPTTAAQLTEAHKYKTAAYYRVVHRQCGKAVLAAGYPISLGISVYESFEGDSAAKTGIIPMPNVNTENLLGGHEICCLGYDDSMDMGNGYKGALIFRNSWSSTWGDKGYGYLPYAYWTNFVMDSWQATL